MGLEKDKCDGGYYRHPLVFLVEAADDITYLIIDIEDAFLLDNIDFETAEKLLLGLTGPMDSNPTYKNLKEMWKNSKGDLQKKKDVGQELIEFLRAKSIGILIEKASKIFCDKEKEILNGEFDLDLLSQIDLNEEIQKIEEFSKKYIYKSKQVLEVEAPAFNVISGLLDSFVPSLIDVDGSRKQEKSIMMRNFMSGHLGMQSEILNSEDDYEKLLSITDYISGMTDTYAVKVFKRLTGASLG